MSTNFGTKIATNRFTKRDRVGILAPDRGFARSGNLTVSLKYIPVGPLLSWAHGNENLEI